MKYNISIKQALITGIILLALFTYCSVRIYQLTNIRWAEIPNIDTSSSAIPETKIEIKCKIEDKLNQLTKDGVPLPGGVAHLLKLRASNGKYIDISVVEGDLRQNTIDPSNKWKNEVMGNGFLLNSG